MVELAESDIRELIITTHATISENVEKLTKLDQAIGDGDHGLNMKRGFDAVLGDVDTIATKPLPEALKAMGMKLVMSIGGASGPLYGTLFMSLGKELEAEFDRKSFASAFMAAVEAVAARGKSEQGQKTMLDVLFPAAEALSAGKSGADICEIANDAAVATIPIQAVRGRASFLGERSIGHMDPGCCSSALLIDAIAQWADARN